MAPWGAFAEEACMHEFGVMPIPDDISFELAASYQMAYGTSSCSSAKEKYPIKMRYLF